MHNIIKFKQQLDASGLTEQQAEQIAISKGMPVTEVQKLRVRLQQLSTTNQTNHFQITSKAIISLTIITS